MPAVRTPLLALVAVLALGSVPQTPAPGRIISLVPAVTEMLFAIGAGEAVIGVSTYDRFPPEVAALPRVGALVDPDVERILSLRPDLVVVYGTQDDLIAQLERAHVPVFRYVHAQLADISRTILRLGERVGRSTEAAATVARIARELEAVRELAARRSHRPRTALMFDREPGALRGMYASGGVGFLHDLLEIAGAENVFADVKRQSLQVSTELLLARQPDVIFEIFPEGGWSETRAARERSVWGALSALPAVRTGRVHLIADDRLAVPGPRVAQSARLLAEALR